ncbi:hypothetical protein [Nonomuraea sp. C10]|uniref:hypothetical protein n=1 Tax=Nonomuraea sp. C10 TaxID=2600577 RepID=UPI0011CDE45E|nr:hypothetical protein [Nonomuraea sp. C10]TXK39177.1 hypothetical protein FR742_05915 [Nonomuraea sp. C10]
MASSNLLNVLLAILSCAVPGIGVVVTAMGRRTHGRAAVIGLLGCVALLLEGLLRLGQTIFLRTIVESVGLREAGGVLALLGLVSFVLATTGVGLLIWAVVARRTPQPAAPGWQQPQPGPQQGWQQPGPPQQQPPAGPHQNPQAGPYQNPNPGPYQNPQGWQQPPS